jgi:HSP20 family protein
MITQPIAAVLAWAAQPVTRLTIGFSFVNTFRGASCVGLHLDKRPSVTNFIDERCTNLEVNRMPQWNPMENLRRDIDRAFEEFGVIQAPTNRVAFLPGRGPRRYPLINLLEDQDNLYIEALTPGVAPQSLNVSVLRNRLTLAGEKVRIPKEVKPEAFHRSERSSGKFVKNFDLPVEVDEEHIHAEYKNGLLIIRLPKAETAKPRQVNVQVA